VNTRAKKNRPQAGGYNVRELLIAAARSDADAELVAAAGRKWM
jgi:hypothetical protein